MKSIYELIQHGTMTTADIANAMDAGNVEFIDEHGRHIALRDKEKKQITRCIDMYRKYKNADPSSNDYSQLSNDWCSLYEMPEDPPVIVRAYIKATSTRTDAIRIYLTETTDVKNKYSGTIWKELGQRFGYELFKSNASDATVKRTFKDARDAGVNMPKLPSGLKPRN